MIHHIVMFTLESSLSELEKKDIGRVFKEKVELLSTIVSGISLLQVEVDPIAGSNVDILLTSAFNDEQALQTYQEHPLHKEAIAIVQGKVQSRNCFDYKK